MLFFIIPVSNDDSDKRFITESLCELYCNVNFLLTNKFNLNLQETISCKMVFSHKSKKEHP